MLEKKTKKKNRTAHVKPLCIFTLDESPAILKTNVTFKSWNSLQKKLACLFNS